MRSIKGAKEDGDNTVSPSLSRAEKGEEDKL